MDENDKNMLRFAVRNFYDIQGLRMQAGGRHKKKGEDNEVQLSEHDKAFFEAQEKKLHGLERDALNSIKKKLKGNPVWEDFLKPIRGIGPTMGGLILAEIDIERAATASALWRFCGLAVDSATGEIERRKKGEKLKYNPWLKSKIVMVLGDCMMRAGSEYRSFYDNYKHRKSSQITEVCRACKGEKKIMDKDTKKLKECYHCKGTGGPAPWAKSPAHLHEASRRYMVKMFLLDLHKFWRKLEGLEVRVPYAEEYLGKKHHAA